jgi:uncharacterized membrane protein
MAHFHQRMIGRKNMRRIGIATALIVALAACGGGSDGGESKTKTMKPANEYVEKLKSLSDANRGLALRRAVQDTGQQCKRVVTSAYQEEYKNLSVWNLKCTDGEYALFIAPNADVQVRSCADAKALGLPQCRFAEEPAKKG